MNILLLFISIIMFFPWNFYAQQPPKAYQINLEKIDIFGTSNITDFKLTFINTHHIKSKYYIHEQNGIINFAIPVESIEGSNRLMVNDFRSLIKAVEFPYINLYIGFDQLESIINGEVLDAIDVDVNIAGILKNYNVTFFKDCLNENNISGSTALLLTDFNLSPGSKFFGMIKLDNKVFINFKINFEI